MALPGTNLSGAVSYFFHHFQDDIASIPKADLCVIPSLSDFRNDFPGSLI